MNALVHYQSALLLRSQRWLAPVILYAAFLAVGVQSGQPILDSLAYAAAALLPVAAWLVRICATNEPPAARSCAAAAVGPWRAQLACLLSAVLATAVLGVVASVVVAVISDPASTDHRTAVNRLAAVGAGLFAMLVSGLTGIALGAVTSRPLMRSPGRAIPVMLLASLLALVTTGSPAKAAMTALVTGSRDGVVPVPLLPVAGAAVLAVAAVGVSCGMASRRG
ncbi:ABC transporter [Streptomyces sp. NPDC057302]|uniref:ABC transporter n=1 Tax=Streptomyces sp. NPDC057302 TaxID=3346094 RepID=UPI00363FB169